MSVRDTARRAAARVVGPLPPADDPRLAGMERKLGALRKKVAELEAGLTRTGTAADSAAAFQLDPGRRLRALLERVEHYQPLYGLPGYVDEPARSSEDRARLIADHLGDLDGLRVLDVGSSLGYMDFYLADRGAHTLGWEMNLHNVAVARAVADLTGIACRFDARMLTPDSVGVVERWRPDAVLLLSVLHHVIFYQGLEAAQHVVARLAGCGAVLVAELARGDEDVALRWSASQPPDPMEVFAGIEGGYDAERLGEFGTHLSGQSRELVAVRARG